MIGIWDSGSQKNPTLKPTLSKRPETLLLQTETGSIEKLIVIIVEWTLKYNTPFDKSERKFRPIVFKYVSLRKTTQELDHCFNGFFGRMQVIKLYQTVNV